MRITRWPPSLYPRWSYSYSLPAASSCWRAPSSLASLWTAHCYGPSQPFSWRCVSTDRLASRLSTPRVLPAPWRLRSSKIHICLPITTNSLRWLRAAPSTTRFCAFSILIQSPWSTSTTSNASTTPTATTPEIRCSGSWPLNWRALPEVVKLFVAAEKNSPFFSPVRRLQR